MRIIIVALFALFASVAQALDYPIVYIRSPITGERPRINDIEHVVWTEPGSDLMLLRDGVAEVLFDAGADGGVLDPCPSLDGEWVYFSYQPKALDLLGNRSIPGATDLYKIHVGTRELVRLTQGEQTPVGVTDAQRVYNVGACPIPGGKVIFESNRNKLRSARDDSTRYFYEPMFQLYVMDDDGGNVEQIGFLNLGGSRHPVLLRDGRIMWSSGEFHGLRSLKMWGLWASEPDGRHWEPLWSAFDRGSGLSSFHWQSQTPDGHVQLCYYYPKQQSGYGNLFDFSLPVSFGSPEKKNNPILRDRLMGGLRFPFQPTTAKSVVPFASGKDQENTNVSHPSAAPTGLLLSVGETGKGTVNPSGGTMWVREAGIYLLPYLDPWTVTATQDTRTLSIAETPDQLVKVVDEPEYFETQPKALVSIEKIYGVTPPVREWIPNPTATPFGWVGSSGVYARESAHTSDSVSPGGLWGQGGDVGEFTNADIDKIRILVQRPTPKHVLDTGPSYPPKTWIVRGLERMAVLGEISLHKRDASGNLILDSAGDPDTSFVAKIPADHSFTFQLIDKSGQALTHAMTWHQVRPGETRTDCRGCHAHNVPGIDFDGTAASKPTYQIADLTGRPETVEWSRDILPLLTEHCGECHSGAEPAAAMNLLDPKLRDSRWVKAFQARQSEIMARVLSEDTTIRMPKGKDPLSADKIRKLATWIDLGAPVDAGRYYEDNQRPTLYVGSPSRVNQTVSKLQFGAFELDGEIADVSVKATWPVNGRPAGAELIDLFRVADSVWTCDLESPAPSGTLVVKVTDDSGRIAEINRAFVADATIPPPPDDDLEARIAELERQLAAALAEIAAIKARVNQAIEILQGAGN